MNNVNMEYNIKFDQNDYIVTVQTSQDKLDIVIEEEMNNVYWKKSLDGKAIEELTSKMGSFKSFDVFTKILLCALSKENESVSLNFCSLNEIQQLSDKNSSNTNHSLANEPESNIKKYLMLVYTQFESVVYPIQIDYLDKSPDAALLQRTIQRYKNELKKKDQFTLNNTLNKGDVSMSSSNYPINYSEFERLKTENLNLLNKIKILESQRQKGAVDNDDIYKQYAELTREYESYKVKNEAKVKMLLKSVEELKESQFSQSKSSFHQQDKSQSKISDLESKLGQASEIVTKERKQGQIFIDEKNKQIEVLKKEIKTLRDNEKNLKVRISQLEKELELANKSASYYKIGRTPKSVRSYQTNSADSKTNSYASSFSKKSATSFLRKNLLPPTNSNPYNKYKGLRSKQYKPFSFMDNKKKSNSNASKGGSSFKSKSSNGSTKDYRFNFNKKTTMPKKPFSKPKVPQASINRYKPSTTTKPPVYTNTAKKTQISSYNNNNTFSKPISKPQTNNTNVSQTLSKYDSNNIGDRLGRIQSLLNQASK